MLIVPIAVSVAPTLSARAVTSETLALPSSAVLIVPIAVSVAPTLPVRAVTSSAFAFLPSSVFT